MILKPVEGFSEVDPLKLVNVPNEDTLTNELGNRIDSWKGFAVATLNLDHIVKLYRNKRYREAYISHTHVVADGNPVVWLCRLSGRSNITLVPGSELIEPLAELAIRKEAALAFLGSTERVLDSAAAKLKTKYRSMNIAACIAPPMDFDPEGEMADAMLDELAASGARICLLALGSPKQEILAARGILRHPHLGFVSIGAGLDFIAGQQIRAPILLRRFALEWFWRLATNPRRLFFRYLNCAAILPRLAINAWRSRTEYH